MLVKNWKSVLRRAWSVRLILLAGLLSGAEIALPLLGLDYVVSRTQYAMAMFAVTAGAFIVRLLAQKDLS